MLKISGVNSQYSISRAVSFRQKDPTHTDCCADKTTLPDAKRNYCLFNQDKVNSVVAQGEKAFPQLKKTLETSKNEEEIVESLYIIDRMIDSGVKGVPALYPAISSLNDSSSQNVQTYLAGIYRKTQIPDAFGPLVKMLVQNSLKSNSTPANEEIGGAILEYLRNYSQNQGKEAESLRILSGVGKGLCANQPKKMDYLG